MCPEDLFLRGGPTSNQRLDAPLRRHGACTKPQAPRHRSGVTALAQSRKRRATGRARQAQR